jgi:hypothetical protein
MKKIVLDQNGEPWGYADVDNNTHKIDIFREKTIDGTPVNVITRRISANKKYEKELQNRGGYETFIKYEYKGSTYYTY